MYRLPKVLSYMCSSQAFGFKYYTKKVKFDGLADYVKVHVTTGLRSNINAFRTFSTETSKKQDEIDRNTDIKKEPWWKPSFLLRKRGYISQSNDEWNSIEFHEESKFDHYVPASLLEKANQEIGSLKNQLSIAEEIIWDLKILVDIRYRGEVKQSAYWILTPQTPTWRQDMTALVQQHLGSSTDDSNDETAPLTPLLPASSPLLPASKIKISAQMDETFLKWLYILFYSLDPYIVSLRKNCSVDDLIVKAQKLTEVLIVVHHATHKIIPNSLITKRPSNEDIKKILVENHAVAEDAVAIAFEILQQK